MKVTVDEETCIGCEACVDACPEVFEMAGDKAVAKMSKVPDNLIKSCREAAEGCPVEAIQLED
jgi:ferredoxin